MPTQKKKAAPPTGTTSKPRKRTTASPASRSKSSVSRKKSDSASSDAQPAVVTAMMEPVVLGPVLRKRELIQRVVDRSGIKKRDAKPVIDAVLSELGEALAENRELVLPPFGKMKVNRQKSVQNGQVFVAKVRRNVTPSAAPSDKPLEPAE